MDAGLNTKFYVIGKGLTMQPSVGALAKCYELVIGSVSVSVGVSTAFQRATMVARQP